MAGTDGKLTFGLMGKADERHTPRTLLNEIRSTLPLTFYHGLRSEGITPGSSRLFFITFHAIVQKGLTLRSYDIRPITV